MPKCSCCGETVKEAQERCPFCNSPVQENEVLLDKILAKHESEGGLIANRYKVLSKIGVGGMGGVYKALDRELNEVIAIKILRPEHQMDPQSLQRFKLETKTTRKLRHPNIVGMFDLYWGDDLKFITMEMVEGITLRSLIKQNGVIPIRQAIDLVVQVLRALEEAHRQGVIHRDIKPGNIMLVPENLTADPPVYSVKVTDFGIAKITSEEGGGTTTGLIIGTPEYMSPEQAEGRAIGPQSDIYSLGIVFYEMLTGKVPFKADTPMATAIKHIKDDPPPLRRFCPKAPERLEKLVMKMLAKKPEQRWRTAGEIRVLLEKRTSLFITPESDLVAKMPSEMERIRRSEETQRTRRKEAVESKKVAKKPAPFAPSVRTARSFPWKSAAIISLLLVLSGIAFFAYKYRLITLNKMEVPNLLRIVHSPPSMVLIPEGEFLMGTSGSAKKLIRETFPNSKSDWLKDEQPGHRVFLKAFYMDRHEVTNRDFKKFVDATGHKVPFVDEEWAEKYLGGAGIAARILYDELKPGIDPFSPENKTLIMTGPVSGTMIPTASRALSLYSSNFDSYSSVSSSFFPSSNSSTLLSAIS